MQANRICWTKCSFILLATKRVAVSCVFVSKHLLCFINSGFSRYFANVAVRDEHFKTKRHKKRYALLNFIVD